MFSIPSIKKVSWLDAYEGVGLDVGCLDGMCEPSKIIRLCDVVGELTGELLGAPLGFKLGFVVGSVEGEEEGLGEGEEEGLGEGEKEGSVEGEEEGLAEGEEEGSVEGDREVWDGVSVGYLVAAVYYMSRGV